MRFLILLLLAGCAGHEAMQWKPKPPKSCEIQVCEVRGTDKACGCASRREVQEMMRVLR
jgi:hypothetical protein